MAETKTFRNPIIPGFAPDPSVVFVEGVFYLATSSWDPHIRVDGFARMETHWFVPSSVSQDCFLSRY